MKIIIVEPNSLNPTTRNMLEQKGVIIIEHFDPEKVRVLNFESKIFTHDILMSALYATEQSNGETYFIKELNRRLLAKEKEKKQKS
jgi:hypothetical protein